uniref:hypothetical protein n=1 Tax=Microbispora cellulosiformans TaxID=2614688 RepID=UPI00178520E2|nr:hypothetical protein [Microbispora cellulosiformans]
MTLNTRPPTCVVPWPLILVEGGEKSGKSWMFAELTASPLVGRSFWLDLGEGAADEYGDISGRITYEVIIHDGSWASILDQVKEVYAEAARAREAGEKPVCLGIDSGTLIWEMLKDWGSERAKGSNANKRRLAMDPNAEVKIPPNVWDDIHARRKRLMQLLMTFPGICVVTARGKESIVVDDNGNVVSGVTTYKVETHKDLPFQATAWIRLSRDAHPMIVGVRSKYLKIRHGKEDQARIVPNLTLEQLIFEELRCSVDSQPRDLVELGRERTPEQVRDDALAATDRERLLELLAEAAHPAFQAMTVENEQGHIELLSDLIVRRGHALTGGRPQPQQRQPGQQAPARPDNRFYREKESRAAQAQAVPPAPDGAGSSPDDVAPPAMVDRLRNVLEACGTASGPAQLAAVQAITGHKVGQLEELTRAEVVRVGKLAEAAAQKKDPKKALAALMGQAMKNRKAAA